MITDAMVEAVVRHACDVLAYPVTRAQAQAILEAAVKAMPVPMACSGNIIDEELAKLMNHPGYVQFIRDDGWQPIETAPLRTMIWLWAPVWRHAFPGMRIGDFGQVYVDTCESEARGWATFATHWRPLPEPPVTGED